MHFRRFAGRVLLILVTSAASLSTASNSAEAETPGNRWLVILCGLPGDDGHRERLTAAVEKIASSAEAVFRVDDSRKLVLVGDETMREQLPGVGSIAGICGRETVASTLADLGKKVQPADSVWVILIGHAQLYNSHSTFNVQGLDFDAEDFAEWVKPVQCREKVYWLTMPASGFWIKPLASPGTVVISATAVDYEFTGTEMPYALADIVSGEVVDYPLKDMDGDDKLSLLDLYLATCLEVRARFKKMQRLETEHALLDDNSDGRGKEVQEPYLAAVEAQEAVAAEGEATGSTEAKAIVLPTVEATRTRSGDGSFAKTIEVGGPL